MKKDEAIRMGRRLGKRTIAAIIFHQEIDIMRKKERPAYIVPVRDVEVFGSREASAMLGVNQTTFNSWCKKARIRMQQFSWQQRGVYRLTRSQIAAIAKEHNIEVIE